MNASFPSESSRPAPAPQGPPQGGRQAPSVPISVYRELATELKATQAMVDSLTQQNHQLTQQNQVLRREMLAFAESADRLRQAVESSQPQMTYSMPQVSYPQPGLATNFEPAGYGFSPEEAEYGEAGLMPEPLGDSMGAGVSNLASHLARLVTPKPKPEQAGPKPESRPKPKRHPAAKPQMLYTEERLEPSHTSQAGSSSADLSGLWLATTILLIVVSAFGAGFLIMKPLLNNAR